MEFDTKPSENKNNFVAEQETALGGAVKKIGTGLVLSIVLISLLAGMSAGAFGALLVVKNYSLGKTGSQTIVQEDSAIIEVVRKASPAVVSIIISKNLSQSQSDSFSNPFFFDPFFQSRPQPQAPSSAAPNFQEVGAGSGFFISADGLILTNKHVVSDAAAKYTVLTNDGKKYDATVLTQDPINDLALVKIKITNAPTLGFADSAKIQIGQRVIAIGNSLGQYSNTVTSGIISGIGRNITAGSEGTSEQLEGVIQTDAAINPGNSGGPLLNVFGQVIGVNTAIDQQGQLVGFAIPATDAQKDIQSYQKVGKIIRPFLGVQYVLITPAIKDQYNLKADNGAWITSVPDNASPAVIPGSAADKAGLKENDIIVSMNGAKITQDATLAGLIKDFNPGDKLALSVLRAGKTISIEVTLGQK